MIIIRRPNPAFFGNPPTQGMDADTASKQTANPSPNDEAQYCRRFVLVPSDATEVKKQEATEKVDPDIIVEKNPLHCRETAEMTTLLLDVASFKPNDLKIEIENHVLAVTGKRTNKLGDTFATNRRFALQPGTYDEDSIKANLDDGILEITIQKRSAPKCRQISINVGHAFLESKDAIEEKKKRVEHSNETNPTKASPGNQVQTVSVETVNERDEDEDTKRSGSNAKNETNEESSASSTRSHEDNWEKVAQA